MDHLSNDNLYTPENHLRGSSSEIVDDAVVEIARALPSPATNQYSRLNALAINCEFINRILLQGHIIKN